MIFATVGTNEAAFDRLVTAVGSLELDEELVLQRGSSTVDVRHATVYDFLSFEEMVEHIRSARAVVSHAGVGSILVALANGKQPIVIPRVKKLGEAVDDHQLIFARRFAAEGFVTLAEPSTLAAAIGARRSDTPTRPETTAALTEEIRAVIGETLGTRRGRLTPR